MSNNISFNSGIKEYTINGDENAKIRINTTDFSLMTRLDEVQRDIAELQEKYKDRDDLTAIAEIDKELRSKINYVFGSDVCTAAFGGTHCMTLCGGEPIFANFLNAIIPIIEKEIKAEARKSNEKIAKYTNQAEALK